jgi:hypothetical protein
MAYNDFKDKLKWAEECLFGYEPGTECYSAALDWVCDNTSSDSEDRGVSQEHYDACLELRNRFTAHILKEARENRARVSTST